MINSPLQGIDNEKLALIPGRFEDLKKFWKTLKSALVESLTTFSYFGKSMVKGSRTLQLSFNHADPSYICKLTLNLLTRQSQISHVIYKSIDEALRALNKNIESYEKELEEARVQSLEAINESIKQLVLARTNYAKDKANYEKVCKETEAAVIEKKKPSTDPLIFYNMTHQRKLEQKVAEALKTLKAAEQQAQDALELYSTRQQSLSAALVESMTSFKATLSTLLGNMIENVKRHNTILSEFFKKELDDFEANQSMLSLDGFTLPSEQEEQQYIENRKQPHSELLDSSPRRDQSPKKEIDPAWRDFKGKFVILQSRLIESPDELSDFEISEYFEIVQKHYEGALTVFEERHKVIRGVRIYMQDLSNLSATVDKIFQKLSKSSMSQLCTTVLGKKLGSTIDPLFEGFGSFGSVFQQLSAYINAKGPVLDIVLNDQKEQLKVFQVEFTKIFKDSNVVRTSLVSSGLQQERLKRKISEINEKDGEDDRLPVLKTELENTRKQREDLLQNLRKKTVDEAKELSKIFGVYRTQEQAKFEDFSNVIKGFLTQEHIFFKGLFDSLTKTESSLQVEINIDEEIAKAIEQDEPLAGFFKHIEKNMASKEGEGETSKPQTMVLKKLYTPPEDLEVDEEPALADGDEDIDQEKGEDEENNKKLAKRFGLKNNEKYIDSYACGVEQKILRQGRMYMYSTAICFSTSKILGDIALSIPLADISKIEKKTMSLVFDTALSITTKNGEIKFLSFFYRDRAYNLIVTLKKESSLAKDANASLASTADSLGISVRQKSKSEFAIRLESQAMEKSKSDKTEETMLERRAGSVEEESGSENQGDMRRKSLVLTEEESAGIKKAGSENGSSRRDSQEIKKEDDKSSNVSIKLDNSSMSEDKDGEDHVPHPESKKSKFSTAHYLTTKMTSPLALSYGIKAKGFQNAAAAHEEEPLSGFEAGSSNVGSSKEASATESKNGENILNTKEVEKNNVSEVRDEEKNKGKANAINQDNEPKGATNTEKVLPKNGAGEVSEKPNENKTNTQKETKPAHPEEKVLKRKDSEEVLREQQHQQELEEAKEKKRLKALIEQRKLKVRKMLLGDEKYETIVVQEVLPCTALDVYNTAFNDKKVTHKGKHYDSFWMLAKAEAGDTNVKYIKWSPHVPLEGLYSDKESVECLKRVAEGSQKSLRDFSYTHPVKGGGPFVPKECQVEEKQIGYWIGPDEFEMQIQVFTSKVPLSDCFVVHNSWKAKDLPNGKCEFVWRLGVEFVKSTFFKGKISSTSKEENGDYANKVFMPLLKEHLSIYLKEKAHDIKKREAKKETDKEAARQERAKRKAEALQKAQEEAEANTQEEEQDSTKETKPEEMSPIKEEEETSLSKQEDSIIKDSVIVEEKKIEEEQGKEENEAKSSEEEKSVDELSQGTEPVGRKDVEDLMGSGVTLRGSFADDFAKFVKASEQNREEMKKEISGLKNLIMVLIAMNCFLVLLYFFKG